MLEDKEAALNRLIEEYQRKLDALPDPTDLQHDYANEEEIEEQETTPEASEADIYDVPSDGEESGNSTTNA